MYITLYIHMHVHVCCSSQHVLIVHLLAFLTVDCALVLCAPPPEDCENILPRDPDIGRCCDQCGEHTHSPLSVSPLFYVCLLSYLCLSQADVYINCSQPSSLHCVYSGYIHVLMRDEKEGRKKQARSNKQTRQSNTAHPRQSLFLRKMSCLMWDSNPRHSSVKLQTDLSTTELPRQLHVQCTCTLFMCLCVCYVIIMFSLHLLIVPADPSPELPNGTPSPPPEP